MPRLFSRSCWTLAVVALAACADQPTTVPVDAPPSLAGAEGRAPGSMKWIVLFRADFAGDPGVEARGAVARHGGTVSGVLRGLNGFSAVLPDRAVQALARDPRVAAMSPAGVPVELFQAQTGAGWGLDRIDQRSLPLNDTFYHPYSGSGVKIYVIDTGVRASHTDFGGRVIEKTYDGKGLGDCGVNGGHGTRVASVAAGAVAGVAKAATVVSMKTCKSGSELDMAAVTMAVNWVVDSATVPAVVNLSGGIQMCTTIDNPLPPTGPGDDPTIVMNSYQDPCEQRRLAANTLDEAVKRVVARGIPFVAAAGNSDTDACTISPARVQEVITVAATSASDARYSNSNHGGCIDIFAPGVNVLTAASGSDSDYTPASGTSFAAPYVAGAIASYLQVHPSASPSQVIAALKNRATPGIVTDAKSTSNYLLFSLLAPSVTIKGPTAYATVGRTYTWTTLTSGGTGSYTYQWQERMMWPDGYQEPWNDISGATGPTLTRTKGSYTVDTEYRVVISTGNETALDTHVVTGSCRLNNTCPG